MLPELIYREERRQDYKFLLLLGFMAGIAGFGVAKMIFPTELDLMAVVFASIPLLYPLDRFFFEDEKEKAPHKPEIKVYSSIFAGELIAFFLLGLMFQDAFSIQSTILGATSFATNSGASFLSIFMNNLTVFGLILFVASVIGSSGAFILTWNASVLGYFFSILVRGFESVSSVLSCSKPGVSPLCYLPHATFEMAGFIVAGVSGSLISAAVYRKDLGREVWIDYLKLVSAGVLLVLLGAFVETA